MIRPHRNQPLWYAFLLHRLSGIGLALFLPLHFYLLALSLGDAADFDKALAWTEQPLLKAAEFGLVFLLAVHLFGGLRLLVLEFFAWTAAQKTLAAGAAGLAFFVACGFLLRAL